MKGILETFEVRVRKNGEVRMYHYDARNQKQAAERAKKHGQVLNARKADYDKMKGDSGKLDLTKYSTAIGMETIGMMDEMNRSKRIDRRSNTYRDKIGA